MLEEVDGLLDAHVENVGDVLAVVFDLQHLFLEARAVAGLARQVDIGHELHLDLLHALALTFLAATARHIEREESGLDATQFG